MKEERDSGKQPDNNAKIQDNLGLVNIKEIAQPILKHITKSRLFVVSVIVGSLIIWSYAASLGLVAGVSTFISNPMLAVAAIVALGFLLLGFILVLCAPMMVYMFLSSLMQTNAITKKHAVCFCYWAISGLLLISLGFFDCIQYTEGFFNVLLGLWAVGALLIICKVCYYYYKNKNSIGGDYWHGVIAFFTVFFLSWLLPFSAIPIISTSAKNEFVQWLLFLGMPILSIVLYFCIACVLCKNKNPSERMGAICAFSVASMLGYAILLLVSSAFAYLPLQVLGFVENPSRSSWYLIHNANANSSQINGLTEKDIELYQLTFNSSTQINHKNALYGYMAWNLGETKVFCPRSVDFFKDDGKTKEDKAQKCLVIEGKYLQPISEYYLTQIKKRTEE